MSDEMIVGIVCVVIGVVMILIGGLFLAIYMKKRKCCSETVVADIVSRAVQQGYRDSGSTQQQVNYYYWCYEYKWNGQTYYQTSAYGITGGRRKTKQMTLYINPNDPDEFLEKRFMAHLVEVICIAIGIFFGLIGLLFI